ncbi:MAG: helix-turn-helix domain-containing protein, partial [Clostridium sp.]|nr:helix-turn-helix domain-containing protein [Clostridium sp.]
MNLPDRIRLIISENDLKQKEFAKSINVTESYISKLLRGESGL